MTDLRERLARLTPEQRDALARRLAAPAQGAAAPRAPAMDDGIAVVAAACRLPGGVQSPEDLWELLLAGRDGVTGVPPQRWDGEALYATDPAEPDRIASRTGGFLGDVAGFDASFFGISPREAEQMDPQQRLLLELAWECFERAGIPAGRLAGQAVGVYVGAYNLSIDYQLMQLGQPGGLAPHGSTGAAHSILANRISYAFDLRGPSMAIDTACSSSLVAVHQACQSLRTGETDAALAGGVNLMLLPAASLSLTKLEILSPTGRCRTFDAAADGIARGEGGGLVLLKRLADALRDGDPVLAVIRGSAVNQDGASNGLTAPSGPAQVAVVRRALGAGGVDPAQVGMVETHGTGTVLGDPVEVEALAEVLGGRADPAHGCYLGAIKTHLGHLEAAAGIAGLIKAIWCVREGRVPANLHFERINPHLRLDGTPLRIPVAHSAWPPIPGPRVAGVSSFGFGGTNAHVVLAAWEPEAVRPASPTAVEQILPVSARSAEALAVRAQDVAGVLAGLPPQALGDLLHTAGARREHAPYRVAVVGCDPVGLAAALAQRMADPPARVEAPVAPVFVFTGQGSHWPAMGRALHAAEPVFRSAVQQVAEVLDPLTGWSLVDVLTEETAGDRLTATAVAQPALFAMQVGLTALWRSWGIQPAAIVGHSVGEIAAAHAAGVLSLGDASRLVFHRGRLMQAAAGQGGMLQVEAAAADLADELARDGALDVAGLNAPETTVLAGASAALDALAARLAARGITARRLPVDFAFHGAQMAPFAAPLAEALAALRPAPARVPLASTLHGGWHRSGDFDAAYWARSLREPVRFAAAIGALLDDGYHAFVEIGPHPSLSAATLACAAARGREITAVPSLRKSHGGRAALMASLATLYEAGVDVDWAALSAPGARVMPLPDYPWQRQSYWLGPVDPASLTFNVTGRRAAEAAGAGLDAPGLSLEWQARDLPLPWAEAPSIDLATVQGDAHRAAADWPEAGALAGDPALLSRLERRAVDHVWQALGSLAPAGMSAGLFVPADGAAWGVAARHSRLWGRLLSLLAGEGLLGPAQDGWTVLPAAADHAPAPLPAGDAARIEAVLMERCGTALAEVLQGRVEPLTLLFPDDEAASASELYSQAPASRLYNRLVAEVVSQVVGDAAKRCGRALPRVLEIGGGTGGTTACVMAALPPGSPYTFTDVTAGFLDDATRRFAAWGPAFEARTLDIEQSPAEQGFAPGSYDVVVAANVIHATGHLGEALVHVRELLAPGGVAILLETLAPRRWTTLTFGLTSGWWRFRDPALRSTDPTLPSDRWLPLLRDSGFDAAVAVGEALSAACVHPQAVLVASAATGPRPGQAWLLVADEGGFAQALARRVREGGGEADVVDATTIADWSEERLAQWLATAAAGWGARFAGVVHCAALDACAAPEAVGQRLDADLARVLGPAARLAAVLPGVQGAAPRLWCVTREAVQAAPDDGHLSPAQAPLWGWGRSMALELPGQWGGLVDLGATLTADQAAAAVWRALGERSGEDQVAWRPQGCRVPRLVPLRRPEGGPRPLDAGGAYLVTGGYGSLGLRIARWLAGRGARQVVLLGRRGPSAGDAEALAAVQSELRALGVTLQLAQGDVADAAVLDALFEQQRRAGRPLRGVVHAAARFEGGAIGEATLPLLREYLRAKVQGTWSLHERFSGADCDLFVLFSSITTVLGAKGLAAYAAANQFLAAVAALRRAQGLAALCVHWGTWHDSRPGSAGRRGNVAALGLQELSDAEALDWLTALVAGGQADPVVARVDWHQALEAYQAHGPRPMLAALSHLQSQSPGSGVPAASALAPPPASEAAGRDTAAQWRAGWRALPPAQRLERVAALVRREVGRVLGLAPQALGERTGFFDLGLDSLMAVQLRRRLSAELGLTLPATLTFNFPTVEALSVHLHERLSDAQDGPAAAGEAPSTPAAAAPSVRPGADDVARLSDEQVRAELLAEFGDLLDDLDPAPEPSR